MVDSKSSEPPIKSPNPSASLKFFFIVTTVYCGFSMFISSDFTRMILKICYILFVIIGQFFINLSLSESMCGLRQWSNALYITVIPWVLIFCVLHFFLIIFPGWMTPFSNTFGYLGVRLMGFPKFLESILNPEKTTATSADSAINILKTDHSILINEMFIESADDNGVRINFTEAVNKLVDSQLFIAELKNDNPKKDKLYTFVVMKHSIAEYIWNILTGFLVTSVTYNRIINSNCNNSSKEMKTRYDAYESGEAKKLDDQRKLDALSSSEATKNEDKRKLDTLTATQ